MTPYDGHTRRAGIGKRDYCSKEAAMSAESYKGGEINSQQAEAISTLASANEYKGKSRIITLLELPWGRKWKYFRDQLLARSAATAAAPAGRFRSAGGRRP